MDSKVEENSIKVFVRVRPPLHEAEVRNNTCVAVTSNSTVTLASKANPKHFTFDHVADDTTTQETVFGCVGRRTVESCMQGYNGTIFAYGQTGSGKTYTMLGPCGENEDNFCHKLRGVIPRCLEHLFHLIQEQHAQHDGKFESVCKCSFLEIYKEQCYDLLDCASTRALSLRECSSRGVFVENAAEIKVESASDAYQVLSQGWKNRRVASTSMNRESSRSHAVFTVAVELKEPTGGVMKIKRSLLNLVDLAGSERQSDARTSGLRLQEASSINRSLSVLGNVMMALVEAAKNSTKSRHVPYRNSKLTFLLRDSLGGNAKTYIIANVHPNSKFYGESLSTLQFMQRAKQIKNKAVVNEDTQGSIVLLQSEIRKLKQQLLSVKQSNIEQPIKAGDSSFHDKFLTAMQMLHRQSKHTSVLKDKLNKQNSFIMSMKMVKKMRQFTADYYRKKIASHEQLIESDVKVKVINALEKENKLLQEQIDNHPDVASYQSRISDLENEVNHLQSLAAVKRTLSIQEEKEKMLETFYQESLEVLNKEHHTSLESDKKQNEALMKRVTDLEESFRQKNKECIELRDAKEMLEVELKGKKHQVEELNKVLEASQAGAKLHLKQINEIHENTIRTITTPVRKRSGEAGNQTPSKVAKYANKPIAFPDILESSLENADVMSISNAQMPVEMLYENAIEDMQRLRNENGELLEQKQAKEKENFDLNNVFQTLTEKLEIAQQNLLKERDSNADMLKQNQEMKNDFEIKDLEVRDLKVMLQYEDKRHAQTKDELKQVKEQLEKNAGLYHEKYITLETKFQEEETAKEECKQTSLMLENELDVARGELDFLKEQLSEKHDVLLINEKKIKQLEKDNKELSEKLEEVIEKQLKSSEEMEENKENLQALSSVQDELKVALKEKYTAEAQLKSVSDNTVCLKDEIKKMKQCSQEDKTAISMLMKQITELRSANNIYEDDNKSIRAQLQDKTDDCLMANEVIKKKLVEIMERDNTIKNLENENERILSVHKFELENMQEDIDSWSEQCELLTSGMKMKEEEIAALQNENKELERKLEEMNGTIEEMKKAENEKIVHEANSASTEENLQHELEVHKRNYSSLQQQFDEILQQYQQSQSRVAQLENINDALQEKSSLQEKVLAEETEKLSTQNSEMLSEYLGCIEELQKKLDMSETQMKMCQEEVVKHKKKADDMKQESCKLQEDMWSLNEEIERLKESEKNNFESMQNYKSQLLQANAVQENFKNEHGRMSEECIKLKEEVAKLAGHTNHLQKIHYVTKIKTENCKLKEENARLHGERCKLQTRVLELEKKSRS